MPGNEQSFPSASIFSDEVGVNLVRSLIGFELCCCNGYPQCTAGFKFLG